jgi:hypothetical protein
MKNLPDRPSQKPFRELLASEITARAEQKCPGSVFGNIMGLSLVKGFLPTKRSRAIASLIAAFNIAKGLIRVPVAYHSNCSLINASQSLTYRGSIAVRLKILSIFCQSDLIVFSLTVCSLISLYRSHISRSVISCGCKITLLFIGLGRSILFPYFSRVGSKHRKVISESICCAVALAVRLVLAQV